jgi:hypothetical protein
MMLTWLKLVFGARHSFPDTSNTRFSSHLAAAAEVVLHLEWYIEFMDQVRYQKQKPGWTNLERNVVAGLKCPATLTELCSAALYYELVEKPYITSIRGGDMSGNPENLLDMAALHEQVKQYCQNISTSPGWILTCSASKGDIGLPKTFTGGVIDRPEVFYAVLARSRTLPHLPQLVSAFFQHAHKKWVTFSAEFAQDEKIAHMSPKARCAAWLNTTNDLNEGALGLLRVTMRRAPNMSLQGYNARMLLKKNHVLEYIESLGPQERAFARHEANRLASGGTEHLRRIHMAHKRLEISKANAKKQEERTQRMAERKAHEDSVMEGVHVELDERTVASMTGTDLDAQINWHRRRGILDPSTGRNYVTGFSKLKVQEKKWMLYGLIGRYRLEQDDKIDVPNKVSCFTRSPLIFTKTRTRADSKNQRRHNRSSGMR